MSERKKSAEVDIKTMRLYTATDRVLNDLRQETGWSEHASKPLSVDVLNRYDQYHYHGTQAVEEAAQLIDLTCADIVLDAGAGVGGTSRYLAAKYGCKVLAVEFQPDVNETSARLTRACEMGAKVTHLCGDFVEMFGTPQGDYTSAQEKVLKENGFQVGSFTVIFTFLVVLHIVDKAATFQSFYNALQSGSGRLVIEDFYQIRALSEVETETLADEVYCEKLTSIAQYTQDLQSAGFIDVQVTDLTASWTEFTSSRCHMFEEKMERHRRVYGPHVADGLLRFYKAVSTLFSEGALGGLRVTARKP
ncbi:hypothetical protein SARC_08901 [Sphaeroforma arctica JP610]|uniref:phosphoethanolamine N-methyltransferase n=1 Tax=Sphaeroforma arctica JP610 TaxID=667725 RepID=A0A0L0FQ75_9EUKA|nr:hypothetical protein SARC_08901 [Sphaeroforma arctica JP610]KNC78676.1 hypothetical protein SARC_08901 [Sphaeroforma arctica JP610]|eukprot:XP_014152578.1 hypothetical protein SARC_08901 [Sphaeroforma arctica JP610]